MGNRTTVLSILQVAVLSPLRRLFDYLPPKDVDANTLLPGIRVRVPFGRTIRIGLVLAVTDTSSIASERLKPVAEILGTEPLLPANIIALLRWASEYYHHPIGEVMVGTLPKLLRNGHTTQPLGPRGWQITAAGSEHNSEELSRAPRQAALFNALCTCPDGILEQALKVSHGNCLPALQALEKKGWITSFISHCWENDQPLPQAPAPELEPAQSSAIQAILASLGQFQSFLLDGVTSSGKTEVYLSAIQDIVSQGKQALVLIPEIGLTPQTVTRFRQRISAPVVVLHSGLTDRERLCAWLAAREGRVSVIIGTRSAIFVPLLRPGIFIVDEEHDPSYKQQDHFRYSARDVAVYRAKQTGVPVVLGSATPSLESLHNAEQGRYHRVTLPQRVQGALHPSYLVTDVRGKSFQNGLSQDLLQAIEKRLTNREQVLLFLNRRGYAPIRLCHSCGWVADCERCDAHMVYHVYGKDPSAEEENAPQERGRLRCHHCGSERPAVNRCPQCGGQDLRSLWAGTQRIAQELTNHFPEAKISRVDRDTIGPKGSMERILTDVATGNIDILVGTQMLAKGHHFPNVTLVGIIDADGGLFGTDFRAGERMAQTIIQVAGRAGRGDHPGQVLIQTHHPSHPLLQALLQSGYHHFAQMALAERREAGLPPFHYLALVRAESPARDPGMAFLDQARNLAGPLLETGIDILGPVPAPMERREGRYRVQLLIQAPERAVLQRALAHWIPEVEELKSGKQVRWSLDVDPQEMI